MQARTARGIGALARSPVRCGAFGAALPRNTSCSPRQPVTRRVELGTLERDRLEQLFEALYEHAVVLEGHAALSLEDWLRFAERWRIRLALERCGGDRTAAARRLGLPRRSLYFRMQQVGLR